MAGAAGIEPTPTVLETVVLPLNYAPKMEESGFEPLNPKERIYSPSRLATSLFLQKVIVAVTTWLSYNTIFSRKKQPFFKKIVIYFFIHLNSIDE